MRNRTLGINVRVNESEKRKLKSKAKKCGLNLSSYLRKCGLNQKLYEVPDEKIYEIYKGVLDLKNELFFYNIKDVNEILSKMQNNFLDVYNSPKEGDD